MRYARLAAATAVGLLTALVPVTAAAVTPPLDELQTEIAQGRIVRIVDDGPAHALSVGPSVNEFVDLLPTREGSVVVSSFRDGRRQLGEYDAWPLRVWTLGEPGSSVVMVPTANSGLSEGPDGMLWVAGEGRFLASQGAEGWTVEAKQTGFVPYLAHEVADDGIVWGLFENGLATFDGEGWTRVRDSSGRVYTGRDLEKTADGTLWLLSERGQLVSFDVRGRTEARPARRRSQTSYQAIDVAPDGELWAVVSKLDDGRCQTSLTEIPRSSLGQQRLTRLEPPIDLGAARRVQRAKSAQACGAPGHFVAAGGGNAWVAP